MITSSNLNTQETQLVEERNFHHLVMDIFWFGLALPATAKFISIYAIRIGATTQQIGWLSSLPALILFFSTWISYRWRQRYPDAVHATVLPGLGFRLIFLLPAFTPFLPIEWQPIWLILAVSLPALPQGISTVTFLVMMRETLPIEKIDSVVSRRTLALNVSLGASTVVLGFWLARMPFPYNYQLMYLFAFVLTMRSLWHVKQMRPVYEVPSSGPVNPVQALRNDPTLRDMMKVVMVVHLAFFFVAPLIPIYLMNELGADETFVAIFVFMELVAGAIVAVLMSRILRKFSYRNILSIAMMGMALSTLNIVLTTQPLLVLLTSFVNGACWAASGVAMFGYFSEKTAPEHVAAYTIIYNQTAFIGVFVGPLLSTNLIGAPFTLIEVLLMGAGLRLAAGLFLEGGFLRTQARKPMRFARARLHL